MMRRPHGNRTGAHHHTGMPDDGMAVSAAITRAIAWSAMFGNGSDARRSSGGPSSLVRARTGVRPTSSRSDHRSAWRPKPTSMRRKR